MCEYVCPVCIGERSAAFFPPRFLYFWVQAPGTIDERTSRTISRVDTADVSSFLVITRIISRNLAQGAVKLCANADQPWRACQARHEYALQCISTPVLRY